MKRILRSFAAMLSLALLFSAAAAMADSIVILKTSAEVNGATVMLSDVFSGLPSGIDRAIAAAPAPGKSVTYDARTLAKVAERYRLDWQPQTMDDRAIITRAAAHITQDMIEAAILAKLEAQGVKGKREIQFDNRLLDVALPTDRAPEFTLNNFDYDTLGKRFRAELVAETGSSPIALPVTGRVLIKRDVPVLAHRMEAGATVGKADIDWLSVSDDRLSTDTVTEAGQLVGRELRHDTAEGHPINGRDLILPRLVTRGSIVIMKIQTPHMMITAQGRALQDGTAGEVVRVTNTQSKRVIEGTVDGPGEVRINTAQKLALAQ